MYDSEDAAAQKGELTHSKIVTPEMQIRVGRTYFLIVFSSKIIFLLLNNRNVTHIQADTYTHLLQKYFTLVFNTSE